MPEQKPKKTKDDITSRKPQNRRKTLEKLLPFAATDDKMIRVNNVSW